MNGASVSDTFYRGSFQEERVCLGPQHPGTKAARNMGGSRIGWRSVSTFTYALIPELRRYTGARWERNL